MEKKDIRSAVITISDRCSSGLMEDRSGPVLMELFEKAGFPTPSYTLIPDGYEGIRQSLIKLSDEGMNLIITTGGTGFSERDLTPEATLSVIERNAPGIAEAVRAGSLIRTKRAMLSRGVSGIRGKTLIINFPGSVSACIDAFEIIEDQIVHAAGLLAGVKMDK